MEKWVFQMGNLSLRGVDSKLERGTHFILPWILRLSGNPKIVASKEAGPSAWLAQALSLFAGFVLEIGPQEFVASFLTKPPHISPLKCEGIYGRFDNSENQNQ